MSNAAWIVRSSFVIMAILHWILKKKMRLMKHPELHQGRTEEESTILTIGGSPVSSKIAIERRTLSWLL